MSAPGTSDPGPVSHVSGWSVVTSWTLSNQLNIYIPIPVTDLVETLEIFD